MKSKIITLCDVSTIAIPEEMKQFRVTEEEMQEQLESVRHEYAKVVAVDQVELYDSVRCRCEEGTMQDRAVMVYPGMKLPAAIEAEQSMLGHRLQDRVAVTINGKPQVLVIEEILRSQLVTVDDDLVRSMQIDQVQTVADYRDWYRKKKENQKKEELIKRISYYLMETMVAQTKYDIDKAEMEAWTDERAEIEYRQLMENGIDPHIPEDGVELLSDEEALASIKRQLAVVFHTDLVCRELCRIQDLPVMEEEWQPMVEECKEYGFSEQELEIYKQNIINDVYNRHTYDYLMNVANACLEEEACR